MAQLFITKFSSIIVLLLALVHNGNCTVDAQLLRRSLHVTTDIKFHLATTHLTSVIENPLNVSSTAVFNFSIPSTAFVSSIVIELEGKIYKSKVVPMEDEEALKQKAPFVVESKEGKTTNVSMAMPIPAFTSIVFNMTYEDVLKRRLGKFEYCLPLKTYEEWVVTVSIEEVRPLTFLRVKKKKKLNTSIKRPASNKAHVVIRKFSNQHSGPPSIAVLFDMMRDSDVGDLLVGNGYFVHFFSPVIWEEVPKDVLLVSQLELLKKSEIKVKSGIGRILRKMSEKEENIHYYFNDCISGCEGVNFCRNELYDDCQICCQGKNKTHLMRHYNPKECKLKCDMEMTLDGKFRATKTCELCCKVKKPSRFSILFYSSKTNHHRFKDRFLPISKANIKEGIKFLKEMTKESTVYEYPNFYRGMKETFAYVRERARTSQGKSVIIYIGNGRQYDGTFYNDPDREVLKRNKNKVPVFPLLDRSHGYDYFTVERLAFESGTSTRMLWNDENEDKQMVNLYNEISTTLLTKVQFSYPEEQIIPENLTVSYFKNYFNGSEFIVSGKLQDNNTTVVNATVEGRSSGRRILFQTPANSTSTFSALPLSRSNWNIPEKIWTHLTIQECFANLIAFEPDEKYQRIGLELSLKHQLLTKFTSMIIPSEGDRISE